jgi:hypothetical protein
VGSAARIVHCHALVSIVEMTVGVVTNMMSEPEDETKMKHPEDRSVFQPIPEGTHR